MRNKMTQEHDAITDLLDLLRKHGVCIPDDVAWLTEKAIRHAYAGDRSAISKRPPNLQARVLADIESGAKVIDICRRYGISRTTVYRYSIR